ncbi:hypothetical protein JCM8547_007302 [Rhodosporidiobolus lusitaniae]
MPSAAQTASSNASKKRGRKQDDSLPPSRSREIQRAFRARRAALLANLERRVVFLEGENAELRRRLGLAEDGESVCGMELVLQEVDGEVPGGEVGKGGVGGIGGGGRGKRSKKENEEEEVDGEEDEEESRPGSSAGGWAAGGAAAVADPELGAAAEVLGELGRAAGGAVQQHQVPFRQQYQQQPPNGFPPQPFLPPPSLLAGSNAPLNPSPLSAAPYPPAHLAPLYAAFGAQLTGGSFPPPLSTAGLPQFQPPAVQQAPNEHRNSIPTLPLPSPALQLHQPLPSPSVPQYPSLPSTQPQSPFGGQAPLNGAPSPLSITHPHHPQPQQPSYPDPNRRESFPPVQQQQQPPIFCPPHQRQPAAASSTASPSLHSYTQSPLGAQPSQCLPPPTSRPGTSSGAHPFPPPSVTSFPSPLGAAPSPAPPALWTAAPTPLPPATLAPSNEQEDRQRAFLLRSCGSPAASAPSPAASTSGGCCGTPSASAGPSQAEQEKYAAFSARLVDGALRAAQVGRLKGAIASRKGKERALDEGAGEGAGGAGKAKKPEELCCGGLIDCGDLNVFDPTPSYPNEGEEGHAENDAVPPAGQNETGLPSPAASSPFPSLNPSPDVSPEKDYLPLPVAFARLARYMTAPPSPFPPTPASSAASPAASHTSSSSSSNSSQPAPPSSSSAVSSNVRQPTPHGIAEMLFDSYPPAHRSAPEPEAFCVVSLDVPGPEGNEGAELRVHGWRVELTRAALEIRRLVVEEGVEAGEARVRVLGL